MTSYTMSICSYNIHKNLSNLYMHSDITATGTYGAGYGGGRTLKYMVLPFIPFEIRMEEAHY